MVKAFCIWCESGNENSKNGYFWIHPDCFNKIMDISGNIKSIEEILKGTHARNRYEKEGQSKIDIILKFIEDMKQFEKQWQGSNQIKRQLRTSEVQNR